MVEKVPHISKHVKHGIRSFTQHLLVVPCVNSFYVLHKPIYEDHISIEREFSMVTISNQKDLDTFT